jgi:hypothetical protein
MHLGGLILGVQEALELLRVALQEGLEAARRGGGPLRRELGQNCFGLLLVTVAASIQQCWALAATRIGLNALHRAYEGERGDSVLRQGPKRFEG